MNSILDIFSNREIATFFWAAVAFALILLKAKIRKPFLGLLKAFFHRKVLIIWLLLFAYVFIIVLLLYRSGQWDKQLLKTTIFWFFGTASVLLFHFDKAKEKGYFKRIIKDSFKFIIFVSFLGNLYCFSLPVELILIPLALFISLAQVLAEKEKKYADVNKILTNTLTVAGFIVLCIVLYKTTINYKSVFTIENLKEIFLPPVLTILFLPFIYLIALYSTYEMLFLCLNFFAKDATRKRLLKREIIMVGNFNLNRLNTISSNLYRPELYETEKPIFLRDILTLKEYPPQSLGSAE